MKTYPVQLSEYQIDVIRLALITAQNETLANIESAKNSRHSEYWQSELSGILDTLAAVENTQKTLFNY